MIALNVSPSIVSAAPDPGTNLSYKGSFLSSNSLPTNSVIVFCSFTGLILVLIMFLIIRCNITLSSFDFLLIKSSK